MQLACKPHPGTLKLSTPSHTHCISHTGPEAGTKEGVHCDGGDSALDTDKGAETLDQLQLSPLQQGPNPKLAETHKAEARSGRTVGYDVALM